MSPENKRKFERRECKQSFVSKYSCLAPLKKKIATMIFHKATINRVGTIMNKRRNNGKDTESI